MTDLPSRDVLTFGPPRTDPAPRGWTFTSSWWSMHLEPAGEPERPSSITIEWYPAEDEADPRCPDQPEWSFEAVQEVVYNGYPEGDPGVRLEMSTHADAYRAFARIPQFFAALADAENHWPSDCTSLDNIVNLLCRLGARPRRAHWDTPENATLSSDHSRDLLPPGPD